MMHKCKMMKYILYNFVYSLLVLNERKQYKGQEHHQGTDGRDEGALLQTVVERQIAVCVLLHVLCHDNGKGGG